MNKWCSDIFAEMLDVLKDESWRPTERALMGASTAVN
jgi:hypothetical protein